MHANIRLLRWISFLIDFKLYTPIAIIYFSSLTGSLALGMSIFSIASISSAIFELPTGILSDFIGRKNTLLLGSIASFFAIFSYSLGLSIWFLFLGAVLDGLSRSFYSGNNEALLHDSLQESGLTEDYNHHHGKINSLFQIALGISALIGGFLAFYSMQLVFWLSLIPQLFCILVGFKLIESKNIALNQTNIFSHLKESIQLFIKNPQLRLLSASSIIGYGFGEAGWLFRSAFIGSVWPLWAIGIPQTLSNIGAAIGFYYAGKVMNKFGAFKILFIGEIYDKIINIFSLLYITVFSPILMTTTSLSFGLTGTASSTLFQKNFTDHQRATMGSLNSFFGSLFFGFAAIFIGIIGDKFSPAGSLLFVQLCTGINLFFYWKLFKLKQN